MNLSNKRVAILVDNYFEQAELEEPLEALKEVGVGVEVVGISKKMLTSMEHAKISDKFQADVLIGDADMEDYDALILPGGAINADSLRMNEEAREWVKYFMASELPLAVICHAPWLLISADVVKGKSLTSYFTIQDDIRNAGGKWLDKPVVVDNNLITSRMPEDINQFNYTIIDMLSRDSGEGDDGLEVDDLGKFEVTKNHDQSGHLRSMRFRKIDGEDDDDEGKTYDSQYLQAFIKMHENKLRRKILSARASRIRMTLSHSSAKISI